MNNKHCQTLLNNKNISAVAIEGHSPLKFKKPRIVSEGGQESFKIL